MHSWLIYDEISAEVMKIEYKVQIYFVREVKFPFEV